MEDDNDIFISVEEFKKQAWDNRYNDNVAYYTITPGNLNENTLHDLQTGEYTTFKKKSSTPSKLKPLVKPIAEKNKKDA